MMSKEAQTIVTLPDQQYEQLLADARRLAASYIEASMKIYKRLGSNLSWLLCQSSKRARTRTRFTGADWCHCKGKK